MLGKPVNSSSQFTFPVQQYPRAEDVLFVLLLNGSHLDLVDDESAINYSRLEGTGIYCMYSFCTIHVFSVINTLTKKAQLTPTK